jgi:hypothetical protein
VDPLEQAVFISTVGLAIGTVLLVAAGSRAVVSLLPALVGWAVIVAAPTFLVGHPSASLAGAVAVGLVGGAAISVLPRRWYAAGRIFFAGLLTACLTYGLYLVRATALLAQDPVSLVVGSTLLTLELGALAIFLGSGFELADARAARQSPPVRPPEAGVLLAIGLVSESGRPVHEEGGRRSARAGTHPARSRPSGSR